MTDENFFAEIRLYLVAAEAIIRDIFENFHVFNVNVQLVCCTVYFVRNILVFIPCLLIVLGFKFEGFVCPE